MQYFIAPSFIHFQLQESEIILSSLEMVLDGTEEENWHIVLKSITGDRIILEIHS